MEGLEEYKKVVYNRYTSLDEEERDLIDTLGDTEIGNVLTKLFGPEMAEVFSGTDETQEEPVDQTSEAIPTEVDAPMEEPAAPMV